MRAKEMRPAGMPRPGMIPAEPKLSFSVMMANSSPRQDPAGKFAGKFAGKLNCRNMNAAAGAVRRCASNEQQAQARSCRMIDYA
jgi:hypothetical protein